MYFARLRADQFFKFSIGRLKLFTNRHQLENPTPHPCLCWPPLHIFVLDQLANPYSTLISSVLSKDCWTLFRRVSYRCDIFLSSPSSNVDRSVKDSCSELSASHCRLKIIASPCQMSTLCNVGDTKSLTVGEHLPCLLGRRLAIMEVAL